MGSARSSLEENRHGLVSLGHRSLVGTFNFLGGVGAPGVAAQSETKREAKLRNPYTLAAPPAIMGSDSAQVSN